MARNFPRQAYPKAYCGAPKVLGDERTHWGVIRVYIRLGF
jgi:hypothetical protein